MWLLLIIFTGPALALGFILKVVPTIYLLLALTEKKQQPEDRDPAIYKKAACIVFILCSLLLIFT
jgi:hypothetical protein